MKKFLFAVLCFCSLFILTSCSKAPGDANLDSSNLKQITDADGVAALMPTAITQPLPEDIVSVTAQCVIDDIVWLGGFGKAGAVVCYTDDSGSGGCFVLPESVEFIYALCEQGDDLAVLCGTFPYSYVNGEGVSVSGNEPAGKLELLTVTQDGTILSQVPLKETYNDPTMSFRLMYEADGAYFISCQSALIKISSDGTELGKISLENNESDYQFYSICMYDGSLIASLCYPFGSQSQLWFIDPITFSVTEKLDFPEHFIIGTGVSEDGKLLINTRTSLYLLNMESKELSEIFLWQDLYLLSQSFFCVTQNDGKYFFYERYQDAITKVEYQPKRSPGVELILATDVSYGNVHTLVNAYNKMQDEVYIRIKVYNEDNYPMDTLLTEIMSGNGPDIFAFTLDESLGEVVSSNVYIDLFPLLDADPEYGREDIVPNLLSAMTEDSALYWLPYKFSILTLVAPESVFSKPGITLNEAEAALSKLGDEYSMFIYWMTPEILLHGISLFSMEHFVDEETATCNFDSPEFIEMLELCKKWTSDDSNGSIDDPFLLWLEPLPGLLRLGGLSDVWGGDYCFVGFPIGSEGGNVFMLPLKFAICNQSKYVEEAYQFLRYTLSDEGQLLPMSGSEFYASQSVLEQAVSDALDGKLTTIVGNEVEISKRDIEKLLELINSTFTVSNSNNMVNDIIVEVASSYFGGGRTAQEAAEIIQSRVGLYIAANH